MAQLRPYKHESARIRAPGCRNGKPMEGEKSMATVLAIPATSSEVSARRYLGVFVVGSLHIAVICVLLTALNIIPTPATPPIFHWRWLPADSKPLPHPL